MNPKDNLVLTGFMGTGKTTVGRLVAEKLDMEFVDTDAAIESQNGPIKAIFEDQGEAAFREIEKVVATELGNRSGLVIATGGKMLLDAANVDSLGRTGMIFCLTATSDEIVARVTDEFGHTDRPLLATSEPRKRVAELLAERAAGYSQFRQIATSRRTAVEVAEEIAGVWADQGT
jgi:shikimate kinase